MSRRALFQAVYDRLPVFAQNLACGHHGRQIMKHRFNQEFDDLLDFLNGSQWWSRQALRDYQDESLRKLIEHAYQTVPYYRRVMDELGLRPADIRRAEDLPKLPLLTKDIIRREGANMLSTAVPAAKTITLHTGGTTGAGLVFPSTLHAYHYQWAVWWRHQGRFGLKLSDYHARIGGRLVTPARQKRPPFWRICRPMKRVYFSSYHMTPENLQAYVDFLDTQDFVYYDGYPSSLYVLADYLRSRSRRLKRTPRLVVTGSESLLDFQRDAFAKWLGAPTTEQYGLAEGCSNVSECERHTLHVDMEFAIIEPLEVGTAPEGRLCRIIGTALHNYAMPFIRYDTTDMATFGDGSCPCGRHSDIVECIDGRVESYIITPDGRRIGRLSPAFHFTVNIREMQIVQEEVARIEVRVVRRPGYTGEDERALIKVLRGRLGEQIGIDVRYVDYVERSRTGKLRAVISRIDTQFIPEMAKIKPYHSQAVSQHDG